MKIESLGGVSGGLKDINQRVKDLKEDAEKWLKNATSGIRELDGKFEWLLSVLTVFFR